MHDIFLSYTDKDRETARRLAEVLRSAGWTVWWDRRISAGETWRSMLEDALDNMRCMIVLWSAHSIESEWVYEEASEGRRQGKLIPILIEPVRPPAGFREIQAADLTGWNGSSDFDGLRLLLADLENLLGKPMPNPADSMPTSNLPSQRQAGATAEQGRSYELADRQGGASADPVGQRRHVPDWALAGALLLALGITYIALSSRDDVVKAPPVAESAEPPPGRTSSPVVTVPPAPTVTTALPPEPPPPSPAPSVVASSVQSPPAAARPSIPRRADQTDLSSARCADFLARIQLGETLSDEAQARYQKECRQ